MSPPVTSRHVPYAIAGAIAAPLAAALAAEVSAGRGVLYLALPLIALPGILVTLLPSVVVPLVSWLRRNRPRRNAETMIAALVAGTIWGSYWGLELQHFRIGH